MSKYSALLFQPDTYQEVGPFRFPIYHDLVPGEAKGIEDISRKQSKSTFKSIKLAQRIAKDKSIGVKEAVELLGKVSVEEDDLLYEYAEELEEVQSETVGAVEQRVLFVTLFMRFRGQARLNGDDWEQLKDWSESDTENMPQKLLNEIFDLIIKERDGWPEENAEKKDEVQAENRPPKKS